MFGGLGMRKKQRRNFNKGLLKTSLMLIFTLFISFSINFMTSNANTVEDLDFISITVKPGDSLWLLADKYDNNQTDLRKVIYDIKSINNIDDIIYPGQEIKIPLYK